MKSKQETNSVNGDKDRAISISALARFSYTRRRIRGMLQRGNAVVSYPEQGHSR